METGKLNELVLEKGLELYKESSKKLDNLFVENTCSNLFDLSLVAIEEMERKAFYREVKAMSFEDAKKRTEIVLKRYFKYWYLDAWRNRKPKLEVKNINMIEKVAEASRMDVAVKFQNWMKSIEEKGTKQGDLFNVSDESIKYESYGEIKDRIKKNF